MGDAGEPINATALRGHIERLTASGPRHRDNGTAVLAGLDHITRCLTSYAYAVEREQYGDAPYEVNLLAELAGSGDGPVLEIGAHWDSVVEGPGADDNASGVAGLLELARVFAAGQAPARTLRFCFFGGEEDQPVGCTGSRAHVARLDAEGAWVDGAIVLEMIGYRDVRPGSQRLPQEPHEPGIDLARFSRADFVAAIGNVEAADYLAAICAAGQALDPTLSVLPVSLPTDHTANGARSDHYPYWLSGRKGVMVTDTAEFRNAHYHQATDTLDTLDLDFAEQVARAVADAVRALSS
jgi:aminopeptidase YwaD